MSLGFMLVKLSGGRFSPWVLCKHLFLFFCLDANYFMVPKTFINLRFSKPKVKDNEAGVRA